MPKAKRKSKHAAVKEPMAAPVRRSNRESRPSQRLREVESLFDVSTLPGRMEEDSSMRNGDLTDQLEVAHERIEDLQIQLNAALASQAQQTESSPIVSISNDRSSGLPSTSTGIFQTSVRHGVANDQQFPDDNFQQNSDNNTAVKMSHQQSQPAVNLDQMLSNAMSQIINPQGHDNEGKKLVSSYLILGATLDPKVKSKIWSREYVELSSLHQEQMDPAVSVSVQDNGKPSISLRPTKSSPASNFYQWLTWFGTYASVYLEKFPEQASSVMTYMIRILELSRKHQGFLWRTYDENFRRMRSYVDMPWHITN